MGKPGHRSRRDVGESLWLEPKTKQINVRLTATAARLLRERARTLGVSVPELLERFARGLLSG